MQKIAVKYLMIAFLLMVYINRGLFISAALEIDNQGNGEINSVIEWVMQLITGEENSIDEDSDSQSNCHFVKIVQHDFSQQIAQNFELTNLFSKNINKFLPRKENIPLKGFHGQIDQPPEIV
jgi:hypothetical protein